jgi:hypothetical protein
MISSILKNHHKYLTKFRVLIGGLLILSLWLGFVTVNTQVTDTQVTLTITNNLTLVPPTLTVNPAKIRVGEDLSFTTTALTYSDSTIASDIVCRLIITAPNSSRVVLQGRTDANGFCNYNTNQTIGSQGLTLIEGNLANVNGLVGFSQAVVEYVFGTTNPTTNTVFYEVLGDQIVLDLYKDRPDIDIYPDQQMFIQADVRNPNPFDIQTVETTIQISDNLELVPNSVRVGSTIRGSKYSSNSFNFQSGVKVNAQSDGSTGNSPGNFQSSVQYLNNQSFTVAFSGMLSAQTIPVLFEVTPQNLSGTNISGTSVILSSGASDSAGLSLSPQDSELPIFTIIRTGGASFGPLILLLALIIIGIVFSFKPDLEEVEVKIK